MMKKTLQIVWKWFYRIVLGLLGLVLLLMIVFYFFRGKIKDKALDYVNELQPGVVYLEKINLRPFMNFPAVSVQLKDLQYSTGLSGLEENDSIPIVRFKEIYVALNVVQLIKGSYKVDKVRLGDGEINYFNGLDSISNIERALGDLLTGSASADTTQNDSSSISLELESLVIRNLTLNYIDIPGLINASVTINGLESGFSYFPEQISASLKFHMDINNATYKDIELDKPRSLAFGSSLIYDQINKIVTLEKSMIDLQDARIEMAADVWLEDDLVDMSFSAQNSGIELLNFLLSGVLDMDAIEQIGDGEISLKGKVNGGYADELPEIELDFEAERMGFNIKAINQSVTDIGFSGYAKNGLAKDFSDAELRLDDFHVSFPDGGLDAKVRLKNLLTPSVYLEISGGADLSIIEQIIETDAISNMKGQLTFDGAIEGEIDMHSGEFLDQGALVIQMKDVAFSLPDNEVQHLEGELFVEGKDVGFRKLLVELDSTKVMLDGKVGNVLPAILDFPGKVDLALSFSAEEVLLQRFMSDTLFTEPIRDIAFSLNANTDYKGLMKALEENVIPSAGLTLENLEIKIPGYAPISDLDVRIELTEDQLKIQSVRGVIGDSYINIRGAVKNYDAYIEKDSAKEIMAEFELSSGLMKASDLFTFNNEFIILPPEFSVEELTGFRFKGKVETSVGELLKNNGLPDFRFYTNLMHWKLKHYPLAFRDFVIDVEKRDSMIIVNKLKGNIGESNFYVKAEVANILDSTKNFSGNLMIASDLIDINKLMDYELLAGSDDEEMPVEVKEEVKPDTVEAKSLDLHLIDYPNFELSVDIGELRYSGNTLFRIQGDVRSTPYKIIYLDRFAIQSETGGSVELNGQFNVADEDVYTLSSTFDVDTVNMSDFNVQLVINDSVYSLQDNFNGILSAEGMAEVFVKPDLSIDLDNSAAAFNLLLKNGRVKNFTPLHAAARFTGNKDLDNVEFGTLENSFSLIDGVVRIPIMKITTSLGLILIEGEQGFGADFLYLVRIPTKLIGNTAWNAVSNQQRKDKKEESEVESMKSQKFVILTVSGKGEEFDVKPGDKRDKFRD